MAVTAYSSPRSVDDPRTEPCFTAYARDNSTLVIRVRPSHETSMRDRETDIYIDLETLETHVAELRARAERAAAEKARLDEWHWNKVVTGLRQALRALVDEVWKQHREDATRWSSTASPGLRSAVYNAEQELSWPPRREDAARMEEEEAEEIADREAEDAAKKETEEAAESETT